MDFHRVLVLMKGVAGNQRGCLVWGEVWCIDYWEKVSLSLLTLSWWWFLTSTGTIGLIVLTVVLLYIETAAPNGDAGGSCHLVFR